MINRLCFIILFFLTALYSFGQSNELPEYTVDFKTLSLKDMDDNYRHLADSIPRFLFYEFRDYPLHIYSQEEITALKQKNLDNYIRSHSLALSSLIEQRDLYIFSTDYTKDELLQINDQIEAEKALLSLKKITDFEDPDPEGVLRFVTDGNSSGEMVSDSDKEPDLVVTGLIEGLEEWIYLKIWVENKITNQKIVIYDSIGDPDQVAELIPDIKNELKAIILGRSWAGLELELYPEDSSFILRDQNNEIVDQNLNILYPGFYSVDVSKPGYKPEYFIISLDDREIQNIEVRLDLIKTPSVSVQSFPGKADVYSGATWLGKTPLFIYNPMFPSLLTLKLDGYNDYKYILNDGSGRDLKLFMQSDIVNKKSIINKKRDAFYYSFSYFLLSIPVSMISYGLSSDYGYAYNREVLASPGSSESERLMQLSTSWYNVYIGGMFINITLFINAVFDLVEYIKSNEKL